MCRLGFTKDNSVKMFQIHEWIFHLKFSVKALSDIIKKIGVISMFADEEMCAPLNRE